MPWGRLVRLVAGKLGLWKQSPISSAEYHSQLQVGKERDVGLGAFGNGERKLLAQGINRDV